MIEEIRVEDINLEITSGSAMYVCIDVFKFVKEQDTPWIDVYINRDEGYTYLDEIVDEFEITEHEELRKEAIKWLFEKVSII